VGRVISSLSAATIATRLFTTDASRRIFESALERVRRSFRLQVYGYVVMPEHVHLLLSEPQRESSGDRAAPLRRKAGLGGRPASSVPVQLSLRDMVVFLGIAPGVETPGYYQTSSGRCALMEEPDLRLDANRCLRPEDA
jgi:hypothetical protein